MSDDTARVKIEHIRGGLYRFTLRGQDFSITDVWDDDHPQVPQYVFQMSGVDIWEPKRVRRRRPKKKAR